MAREEVMIRVLRGDTQSAFGLFLKLGARGMLESASVDRGRERYSVILADEAFRVLQLPSGKIEVHMDGRRYRVGGGFRDILDVLAYFANQHEAPRQDLPFPAGGVGFLSYEFASRCDAIEFRDRPDELGLPDAAFLFAHAVVIFDHLTELIYLVGLNYREHRVNLSTLLEGVEAMIRSPGPGDEESAPPRSGPSIVVEEGEERGRFEEGVERIRREIVAGNLLQAVLSRRRRVRTRLSALEAYRTLRASNPSPYMFYLDFGAYRLFGASPEMHVKVRSGRIEIRPIAGTRRRGASDEEDRALEAELLEDPKERAEHLMLVDLARNDIGRVCKAGTVQVDSFMTVERYSHVMHIVSAVSGRLAEGKTGADAIRGTFPAGTVSGAPKIQAMRTLDELEDHSRRFYAGLVGYMEPGGDVDTCIAIRTALARDGEIVLQAGAGVVFDSDPAREYRETEEKLGALAAAVGLEVEG